MAPRYSAITNADNLGRTIELPVYFPLPKTKPAASPEIILHVLVPKGDVMRL